MKNTKNAAKPLIGKPLWAVDVLNMVGRGLRSCGVRVGDANAEAIIQQAMKKSGISTIIDDSFREPLDVLVQSANQQSNFSFLGRLSFRAIVTNFVATRLQIDATLAATPEILETPLTQPIFIAALPRTGTTLLHRLFAQDASLRIPQHWEMALPCPPPEKERYATDPRIHKVEQELAVLDRVAPQLKVMHEIGACFPEECILLFANDLISDWFVTLFDLPGYLHWLDQHPLLPVYERHRKQLQLLQYRYSGERWVLKAPAHLRDLTSLMQVYPDAYIIQTHRDPSEVIPSAASLLLACWNVFHENIRSEDIGEPVLEFIGSWVDRSMAAREQAESDPNSRVRFLDVDYKDLVTDPLGTIRNLYAQCDLAWSLPLEHQMMAFFDENRQYKHGKHQYTLDQFGLNKDRVHERFAGYTERFLGQA